MIKKLILLPLFASTPVLAQWDCEEVVGNQNYLVEEGALTSIYDINTPYGSVPAGSYALGQDVERISTGFDCDEGLTFELDEHDGRWALELVCRQDSIGSRHIFLKEMDCQ